ncbi:YtxH domain-containing protein [Leucobacter muris]|uniref:YtxH domain-containing protein n=1 Tax=Leucobacter muris TaxID=1935379 RepID=A0ABX5QCG8_9MICO|nr:YtxH domain-containing protein [Leucobacter muris]QAB16665.1 YtxH domain-containing protein [Leucobacter muris]
MKGKIAFVLGAAVGYVLGTRAGRERYEQIKNGAQTLWHTAPVQRGVSFVRDVAQTRVDELKASATRAGKSAMAAFLRDDESDKRSTAGTTNASTASKAAVGSAASEKSDSNSSSKSDSGGSSKSASSNSSSSKSSGSAASKKRGSGASAKSGGDA